MYRSNYVVLEHEIISFFVIYSPLCTYQEGGDALFQPQTFVHTFALFRAFSFSVFNPQLNMFFFSFSLCFCCCCWSSCSAPSFLQIDDDNDDVINFCRFEKCCYSYLFRMGIWICKRNRIEIGGEKTSRSAKMVCENADTNIDGTCVYVCVLFFNIHIPKCIQCVYSRAISSSFNPKSYREY